MTVSGAPGTICDLVTGLDPEGAGVIEKPPFRFHIAGALTGERVSAATTHVSPHSRQGIRDVWAQLETIALPSPQRSSPACPAFGLCGGCTMQHLDYPEQVQWKTDLVRQDLASLGNPPPVLPCLPAPQRLGYRNQAKYVYSLNDDGRVVLGAYAPRSHRVVDLAGCRMLEPGIDDVAQILRRLLEDQRVVPFDETTRSGDLRHVALRANYKGEILVTVVTAKQEFTVGPSIAKALMSENAQVVGVVQNVNPGAGNAIFGPDDLCLAGDMVISERVGSVDLELTSRSFFQLNRAMAAQAYQLIHNEVAALAPTGLVVDAYAGVGGIAFSLAAVAPDLLGIESNPSATEAAQRMAAQRTSSQIRFVSADAALGLGAVSQAEVVVLNPPRAGCSPAALEQVVRLRPRLVAYLSCNPKTLARDLSLLAQGQLIPTRIQPLDMLPQTTHVETLVMLGRR